MSADKLRSMIIRVRMTIREHRNQLGDDRCWLDDDLVYEVLPESSNHEPSLPSKSSFMKLCKQFHRDRQSSEIVQQHHQSSSVPLDIDLEKMDRNGLISEIHRLYGGIRKHRSAGLGRRTAQDDKELYELLPDNILADTRLPSATEFLTSCEKFFDSRGNPPKLHEW